MTDDPKRKPSLELVLAQQANDAIAQGADPQEVTARLGRMVQHVRSNPVIGQHGADALSQGADPGAVTGKLWDIVSNTPEPVAEEKPGLLSRVGSNIASGAQQFLNHPIDTAKSIAMAVPEAYSTITRYADRKAQETAAHLAGKPEGFLPADPTAPTGKEAGLAMAQLAANLLAPEIAGGVATRLGGGALAKLAGTAAAGAPIGAAYDPNDPLAGALTGTVLAPALHGVAKATGGVARVGGGVLDRAVDLVGRPERTQTITAIGRTLATIEGVQDRATRLNARALPDIPRPATDKPLAPVDLGGVPAQRLARGLKTSSPAAEQILRGALKPRADAAVDRVIQHGLETTGLVNRESGLRVVDDLIAKRAEEGRQNYEPLFKATDDVPLDDPAFTSVLKTPAGQAALKRGMTIAANRGEKISSAAEMVDAPAPEGVSPADWEHIKQLAKERGVTIPQVEGQPRFTPTLRQAHYIKLGFDDMLNSAPEPGSGGSGPNNASAVRALKSRWLKAMDAASPEYGEFRKLYADDSDLIRAGELGRKLFSLHPDEAAKAFGEMSEAERQVARRTGFDALASRVENGPKDVERGMEKPRDQQRLRLLFPTDDAFNRFREGLRQEGQMHATQQGVLGGSNTADKLADLAGMANVSLPDIFKAARGNPIPLVTKAAHGAVRRAGASSLDNLAAERARQLVAGANGDPAARLDAIVRMEVARRRGATGRAP